MQNYELHEMQIKVLMLIIVLVELLGIVVLWGCQCGFVAIGSVYWNLVCFVYTHLLGSSVEIGLMLLNLHIH